MRYVIPVALSLVIGACATSQAPISSAPEKKPSSAVRNILELSDLRREVATLRNLVELQQHELEGLRRRQTELYDDLDQRLRGQERQQPGTITASDVLPAGAVSSDTDAANGQPPIGGDTTVQGAIASTAEQTAYDAAFELLGQSKYTEAISAFDQQLKAFPNGPLADDAQYWIGESHYVNRDLEAALMAFEQVTETYASSNRYPEALLKIGYLHDELGRSDVAKQVLNKVIQQYPGSRMASSAEARLNQINQ